MYCGCLDTRLFAIIRGELEETMDSSEAPVNEASWKQYSVLVVDDEPGMLSFLQRALGQRCGSVDTAGSVEQAEPLLKRRLYDLIVLDIALPGRSGIDWLHELRDEGYAGDVAAGPNGGFVLSAQRANRILLWQPQQPGQLTTIGKVQNPCGLWPMADAPGVAIGGGLGLARWHATDGAAMLRWPSGLSAGNHWAILA